MLHQPLGADRAQQRVVEAYGARKVVRAEGDVADHDVSPFVAAGKWMYVSIRSRASSVSSARRRCAARGEVALQRVEDAVEREVVAVLVHAAPLGLVAVAVGLPRDREAHLVGPVARDGRVLRADAPAAVRPEEVHARPQRRERLRLGARDRRRGRRCRCRARWRCCGAPRACAPGPRGRRDRRRARRLAHGRSRRCPSRSCAATARTDPSAASPPSATADRACGSRRGTPARRCGRRAPARARAGSRTRCSAPRRRSRGPCARPRARPACCMNGAMPSVASPSYAYVSRK